MKKEILESISALRWYKDIDIDDNIIDDDAIHSVQLQHTNIDAHPIRNNISDHHTNHNFIPAIASMTNEQCGSRQLANAANTLAELKSAVTSFDGCALKYTATNTVFGDGVHSAPIMLIGEAPGYNEDKQSIPFCGESGKLLDNMLKAINLSRIKNVYITNTIFWRPPANRCPTSEEIAICKPFVEKHIAIINPKLIILVGSTAATSMLGNHIKISKIRREYFAYQNCYLKTAIPTTAIFHPAYLLRQPLQKKASWHDLLNIQQFIERKYQL